MKARRTQARLAIAAELLLNREKTQWGYELSSNSGVGAGSMYPFLSELLAAGYLEDGWEDAEQAQAAGKPPRRFYRVTDEGEKFLRSFVGATPIAARKPTAKRWLPVPKAVEM